MNGEIRGTAQIYVQDIYIYITPIYYIQQTYTHIWIYTYMYILRSMYYVCTVYIGTLDNRKCIVKNKIHCHIGLGRYTQYASFRLKKKI